MPVERAHKALFKYFDDIAVKPEISNLYLRVKGTIFKANEAQVNEEVKRVKESLSQVKRKLISLEEKFITSEIEKDSYSLMKPKFKEEIKGYQKQV